MPGIMNTLPQLNYQLLGPSGLRVSTMCLGAMTFGTDWGWGASAAEARRMLDLFATVGGNFIDTADFYTGGSSERILGEALEHDRDRWVIATKYGLHRDPNDPNAQGNHRKNLVRAVEASLKRLRTDHIDLLWVHAWDFTMQPEDVLWGLEHLTRGGKVLHLGLSDTPAWIAAAVQTTARLRGWQGLTAIQVEYSLRERTGERDLLPMAAAAGLGVTAWSPLGSGTLTGKYLAGTPADTRRAAGYPVDVSEGTAAVARAIGDIASTRGCPPAQVALAWILARRPRIIPIIGARTATQLEENVAAASLSLHGSELARLDDVSAITLGFPHDFLRAELARFALWGNVQSRLQP